MSAGRTRTNKAEKTTSKRRKSPAEANARQSQATGHKGGDAHPSYKTEARYAESQTEKGRSTERQRCHKRVQTRLTSVRNLLTSLTMPRSEKSLARRSASSSRSMLQEVEERDRPDQANAEKTSLERKQQPESHKTIRPEPSLVDIEADQRTAQRTNERHSNGHKHSARQQQGRNAEVFKRSTTPVSKALTWAQSRRRTARRRGRRSTGTATARLLAGTHTDTSTRVRS